MSERPDLTEAWHTFVDEVTRALHIDRAVAWIADHLPGGHR